MVKIHRAGIKRCHVAVYAPGGFSLGLHCKYSSPRKPGGLEKILCPSLNLDWNANHETIFIKKKSCRVPQL